MRSSISRSVSSSRRRAARSCTATTRRPPSGARTWACSSTNTSRRTWLAARDGDRSGGLVELHGPPRTWLAIQAEPLPAGGAVATTQDVSERHAHRRHAHRLRHEHLSRAEDAGRRARRARRCDRRGGRSRDRPPGRRPHRRRVAPRRADDRRPAPALPDRVVEAGRRDRRSGERRPGGDRSWPDRRRRTRRAGDGDRSRSNRSGCSPTNAS